MKIFKFLTLLLLTPVIFNGCASTGTGGGLTPEQVTAFIQNNQSTIEGAINTVRRLAVSLTIKDKAKAAALNAKITAMATQLNALLQNNDLDPAAVAQALVIKEEWAQDALSAIPLAWGILDSQIKQASPDAAKQAQLYRLCLQTLAAGLSGTPTYVVKTISNQS